MRDRSEKRNGPSVLNRGPFQGQHPGLAVYRELAHELVVTLSRVLDQQLKRLFHKECLRANQA